MEDLTEKITDILGDPEMMNTIKSISGLLDHSEKEGSEKESEPSGEGSSDDSSGFSFSPEMMQMVLKFMPILASIKKEDKYTKFLEALKPLLSEKRRKKLEGSSQILKIIRILPLLKDQGIL